MSEKSAFQCKACGYLWGVDEGNGSNGPCPKCGSDSKVTVSHEDREFGCRGPQKLDAVKK